MIKSPILVNFSLLTSGIFIHFLSRVLRLDSLKNSSILPNPDFRKGKNPLKSNRTADTTYWTFTGLTSITLNQTSFTNWAAGGINTISLGLLGNYSAVYDKDKWNWNNLLEIGYGIVKLEDQPLRKNEDRIGFVSKLGYRITPKLMASARAELKTQFTNGFAAPPNDSIRNSTFMAPGRTMFSLGLDYLLFNEPTKVFSIGFYPVTNKITYVLDQELADQGLYGVKAAIRDTSGNIITHGEKMRVELVGALLTVFYKQTWKRANIQSRLELFNNYTDKDTKNRVNIDVNWETTLGLQITKWFGTSFFFHLMYDQNTPISLFKTVDGKKIETGKGPRLQIKQAFGIALTFNFTSAKKK